MSTDASRGITPYTLFKRAIDAGIAPTVHDCWFDFSCWEKAREFYDDPGHPAKAAIEWVCALEDVRAGLDEFSASDPTKCYSRLDRVYEDFAKMQHSDELLHGIETWIEARRSE